MGFVVARIVGPEPGMDIYDPCCGSAGLLVKCEIVLDEKASAAEKRNPPLFAFTAKSMSPKPGPWPT